MLRLLTQTHLTYSCSGTNHPRGCFRSCYVQKPVQVQCVCSKGSMFHVQAFDQKTGEAYCSLAHVYRDQPKNQFTVSNR